MILDALFKRKKDDKTASQGSSSVPQDSGDETEALAESREALGLAVSDEEIISEVSGVAADVRPGQRAAKKTKTKKVNRALVGTARRRLSHTRRSFALPEGRPLGDQVHVFDVLERPIFTEKAATLSERGVYSFIVRSSATKHTVADAIEALYGVRPERVHISRRPAKPKRVRIPGRERERGVRAAKKKAYVFLKEGDKIKLS